MDILSILGIGITVIVITYVVNENAEKRARDEHRLLARLAECAGRKF